LKVAAQALLVNGGFIIQLRQNKNSHQQLTLTTLRIFSYVHTNWLLCVHSIPPVSGLWRVVVVWFTIA